MTHFPIAFTVLAALLQLLAVLPGHRNLTSPALIVLGLATVGALAAAFSGTAQAVVVDNLPDIRDPLELHENLGNITAWLLSAGSLVAFYLHLKGRLHPWAFLAALVLAAGYSGGELVYRFGAGVER